MLQKQRNTDIVIGLQWGDEGKGKIVDILANQYDAIIRANGGNNAGHSIAIGDKSYAVHALPSGVLQKDKLNIIASGCVVNPFAIVQEIEKLGDDFKGKLIISERCPLIMNKFIAEDIQNETEKGNNSIGTTLKGIGPTYASLKNRDAIFTGDLLNIKNCLKRFSHLSIDELKIMEIELEEYKSMIGEYIHDVFSIINKQKTILLEGAQATMLDNLYGTYPYVTSSNTIVSGLMTGSTLNHQNIRNVIGVTKAYTTRVGNGPFISEDLTVLGDKIREIGKEVGVSTGRPRRTGWLDLVQLKYAIQLNGVTELAVMKSDVLDTFENIKVCTGYKHKENQSVIEHVPFNAENYDPIYIEFKGWLSNTYGETEYHNLPNNLKEYLTFISKYLNIPIKYISTGPTREQICKI